jgi:hypothetical protein
MGCGSSKHTLERVDDSVHVMLAHEKKVAMKKGEKVATHYVPRAEHPLLQSKAFVAAEEDDENDMLDKALKAETEEKQ